MRCSSRKPDNLLSCDPCDRPIRMGNNRILYCPGCKETSHATMPHSILCCAECENPLSVTESGSGYCTKCRFIPSMQDTFLWEIAKIKNPI